MGSPPVTAALVKPPRSRTCESVRQVNMGIHILELCNHTTFSRNQQNHVEEILKLVLEIIYTHSKLNFAQKTEGLVEKEAGPLLQHAGIFCCCDNSKDQRRHPWMLDSFCVYTTLAFSQMLSALWFTVSDSDCRVFLSAVK